MMTPAQRKDLIAHMTNGRICHSLKKDMLSLCSSVDSDLEMYPTTSGDDCGVATAVARTAAAAAADGSDDSEQVGPQDTRAAQHTHTA